MKENKELLNDNGWQCNKCACPGQAGWDCANSKKRGYVVTLRNNWFKILLNGHIIVSEHTHVFEEKLRENFLID